MSRHRSRLARLGRTASTVPPTEAELVAARRRARDRATARTRRKLGALLTDAEIALLEDQDGTAADLDTHRRNLRAQGIDPDRDDAERRARLRERDARGV